MTRETKYRIVIAKGVSPHITCIVLCFNYNTNGSIFSHQIKNKIKKNKKNTESSIGLEFASVFKGCNCQVASANNDISLFPLGF